jgi:hypothetical protein
VPNIYSSRLLFAALSDGETATFVCPAGFRAVLRETTVAQVEAGAGSLANWVLFDTSGAGVIFHYTALPGANSAETQSWRLVFEPGESIVVRNDDTPTLHVTASGYLLTLP